MKRTILVVDDEADAIGMITQILEDADCRVIAVNSGEDGIKQLAAGGVDLLISDIFMPEMEGLEFIRSVREAYPALPIVAISGGGTQHNLHYLKFAGSFGALASLSKPFRREELMTIVDEILPPKAQRPPATAR
jgi:CheY-like chemotaxis protein